MIKHILLDLDNTLLDFTKAEHEGIRKGLAMLGIDVTDELLTRYSQINMSFWEKLERGEIERSELLWRRFDALFAEMGIDADGKQAQDYYEEFLSKGHDYLPGAEALLNRLYGHYSLYIVSNGNTNIQERRIADSGIEKYFDGIFISEKLGYDKPNIEFFENSVGKVPGFDKNEAIIIGDSLTSDILGGNNYGIKTCWFNPKHKTNNIGAAVDYEVSSLDEIPNIFNSETL